MRSRHLVTLVSKLLRALSTKKWNEDEVGEGKIRKDRRTINIKVVDQLEEWSLLKFLDQRSAVRIQPSANFQTEHFLLPSQLKRRR